MVRAFLTASAEGFQYAAAHPEAAAEQLLAAVNKEYTSCPLPEPLDLDMVKEAQVTRGVCLFVCPCAYYNSKYRVVSFAVLTWPTRQVKC